MLTEMLPDLVARLSKRNLKGAGVIPWSSPVPSFGDIDQSELATVGLNPSNREFVDQDGRELSGPQRRFPTLRSLGLASWEDARREHVLSMAISCRDYFHTNPYDGWFRRLDRVIDATGHSYYGSGPKACHLDLIPYATSRKWMALTSGERRSLLSQAGDTLGMLLRESPVKVLVLNGRSVVDYFVRASDSELQESRISSWSLPRTSGAAVAGIAYTGTIRSFGAVDLKREIRILGFNHNIQSSFGVTTQVTTSIRRWIARSASGWLN